MRKSANIGVRAQQKPRKRQRRPPTQRPIRFLSRGQVEQFFAQIPQDNVRDLLLFDLIYRHGLRRGEASLMELEDVRHDELWVWRLKGGEAHWHPLHGRSKRLLRMYLDARRSDPCPYLFRGRRRSAEPLSEGAISHLFHLYAKAAALPPKLQHVHALRHSCGTHLARAGWDLADVKWWLGHKDIKSTEIYFQDMPARVAEKYRLLVKGGKLARTGDFN